jgi:cytochrome P450
MLREGMLDAYLRWALEQRDDFEVWAGPVRHIVVVRPESVRQVLGGSAAFERNIGPTGNLFGRGMLRLDGAPWRARRQLFSPPFRRDAVDALVPIVQEETDRLITAWRAQSGAFKPTRELSFLTLRVLGRVFFGFDFDASRHGGRPLHAALITLATDSLLRHLLPRPLVAAMNHRAVASARRFLDALCETILRDGADTPFMATIRDALADGSLDHATAIDELRTFLIAGHETTATALAWTVALVASRPELLTALRGEAAAAAAARTPEDVAELDATLRLVKEVMRLYPPVPLSTSLAVESTTLGRLQVRRGAIIDICSYVLHRLPWSWPEPARLDPGRFLTAPAPGTWIPFLNGPHTCIGARVALCELPLIAARLIDAFDFGLPAGPPRVNLRISLNPAGLVITARPRHP